MMDNETRTLLLDLQGWFESPERAGPGLTRAGFLRRIKKALAAKRERELPPLAEKLAVMGASAHAAGRARIAPGHLTMMAAACWLQGYDAASEAAIDAEVTK